MIELFSSDTPNGKKISIMLEEIGLNYKVTKLDLGKGDQFKPEFKKISPFAKIPAIVDNSNNSQTVFESGAILIYLAERSGKFYDKNNKRNNNQVIKKFRKKFVLIGVNNLEEIDSYKFKLRLDYLYIQKSGQNDAWQSNNIKTIVHSVYPQKLKEAHGDKYAFISSFAIACKEGTNSIQR